MCKYVYVCVFVNVCVTVCICVSVEKERRETDVKAKFWSAIVTTSKTETTTAITTKIFRLSNNIVPLLKITVMFLGLVFNGFPHALRFPPLLH